MSSSRPEPSSHWWRWLIVAVVCVAIGGITTWALLTVLRPAQDPLSASSYTLVDVTQGEIGSSISLNTAAEWTAEPVGANQAVGVVTSVVAAPGAEVRQGSLLYTVNLKPTVIAQGDVPAFRVISSDTAGADVTQLQGMLTALGYYRGAGSGKADSATIRAIKTWQKSLGVAQTGVVDVGDVIYVPALPTRISLDDKIIARAKSVSGGEPVVRGLPPTPAFTIPVTQAQAAMMPTGTRVLISSPEGAQWEAYAAGQTPDPRNENVVVTLAGKDGVSICGDQCSQVPVSGQSLLRSKIITVESTNGLVVPSAALVTNPNGSTAVVGPTGTSIPVKVVASARGMSVIEGAPAGTKVRIPVSAGSR